MKVLISPRSLGNQLPELRLDILQIYDCDIILEVREMNEQDDFEIGILKKYPHFTNIFTRTELSYLNDIAHRHYTNHDLMVRHNTNSENNVVVHFGNINKKIVKHDLPIAISAHKVYGRKLIFK